MPSVGFEPTIFSLQVKRLATGPKRLQILTCLNRTSNLKMTYKTTTVFRSTIELRRELLTGSPRGRQTPRDLSVSKQVLLRIIIKLIYQYIVYLDILFYTVLRTKQEPFYERIQSQICCKNSSSSSISIDSLTIFGLTQESIHFSMILDFMVCVTFSRSGS